MVCELQKIVLTESQRISQKLIKKVPNASYNSRVLAFGRLPTYFWVKPYCWISKSSNQTVGIEFL